MRRIELLAPAGNFEAFIAAVESGADAIYMGGSKFNARAFADNFDDEALQKAVSYAHIRGVKVYITINILLTDEELEATLEYINYLYSIDVDAIIVQDIALLRLVREMLPDFEIHCSTQMTVHNSDAVRLLTEMGAKRIVVSRELSIAEIKAIIDSTGAEVEAFVHGALCVCYSGQCYMSSMIGGRSGNRGRCAQSCRRRYSFCDYKTGEKIGKNNGKYALSTRDLNTYARLKELVESGITSFKIEGRMKRPEYVAAVVKNYRDAIDRLTSGRDDAYSEAANSELTSVFNREFTEGYLFNKRNSEIVSIERPDNRGVPLGKVTAVNGRIVSVRIEAGSLHDGDGIEIIDKHGNTFGSTISGIKVKGSTVLEAAAGQTAEVYIKDKAVIGASVRKTFDSKLNEKIKQEYFYENRKKIHIECRLSLKKGEHPLVLLKDSDGNQVEYIGGNAVAAAVNAPLTKEKVREQFSKTGDTPYIFKQLDIVMDDDCFMPVKELNHIRREALERLNYKRAVFNNNRRAAGNQNIKELISSVAKPASLSHLCDVDELIAGVRNYDGAKAAIEGGADTIYLLSYIAATLKADAAKLSSLCLNEKRKLYITLPIITKDKEMLLYEQQLAEINEEFQNVGIVVSNLGQLLMAERLKFQKIRINYSMNVFNSVAAGYLSKSKVESVAVSPELNLKQIKVIAQNSGAVIEAFAYGHLPLMTLEYCPESIIGEGDGRGGCGSCGGRKEPQAVRTALVDEKGKAFPILKLGNCRTQLLNSDAFLLVKELDKLKRSGIAKLRADFYLEEPKDIYDIIKLYKNYDENSYERLFEGLKQKGHTKGHYFRGVD